MLSKDGEGELAELAGFCALLCPSWFGEESCCASEVSESLPLHSAFHSSHAHNSGCGENRGTKGFRYSYVIDQLWRKGAPSDTACSGSADDPQTAVSKIDVDIIGSAFKASACPFSCAKVSGASASGAIL